MAWHLARHYQASSRPLQNLRNSSACVTTMLTRSSNCNPRRLAAHSMKHSLLVFLIALPLLALNPSVGSEDWILDDASGCSLWNPDSTRYSQIRWIGSCVDGRAEGTGLARWWGPEDRLYAIGEFHEGRLNGLGIAQQADGSGYSGQWQAGIWHGNGTYRTATGDRYAGGFLNGRAQGHGVLFRENGDRYEGAFHDGNFNGKGMYFQSDGSRLEAEWSTGKAHGLGVASWANGDHYAGDWLEQRRSGLGVQRWASGDHYAGDWLADQRTGQGVYDWPSGGHYEGTFAQGKLTGLIGEPNALAEEVAGLAAEKAKMAEAAAAEARESAHQARVMAERVRDSSTPVATQMELIASRLRELGYGVHSDVAMDETMIESVDEFLATLEPLPEQLNLDTLASALTQAVAERGSE